ncbi:DUF481 domain-containing protein [Xanthomarina sp. F2636L]|uniref:DUF481 domain-containing protein n=1 Tax=Xanthomarina sp. F2636L TaxID=2996018 RepID=UPI00225E1DFA|nr:DUF481 domain-containing protein [Xanthomarina sp. F2636L]MCX7551902.1 DUF481 domain-containing protein [Xanthomarina sp. F2636L]
MSLSLRKLPTLTILICLFYSNLIWSQNDTLVLKNKDKIIGEIKSMDRGVLTVKTSYSDSDFKITWLDIISVRSEQSYLLTLSDGRRINSSLYTKTDEVGKVTLNYNEEITTDLKNIVYIKPVENDFLSRLTASVSLGFNITKSNNLSQFSVSSDLSYTAYKWLLSGSYNSVRSNQNDVAETHRTDANVMINYFMKNDWFYSMSADFLSNDEQKLKLRSTVKGGLGKYVIHTNRLYFGGGFGLAFNNEQYTDELNTNRNSLEAYGGVQLNIFDLNDISLSTDATFFPSLTEGGRYRLDYNLNFKYDLPLDFFIKLSLSYNYDSKPVEETSNSDYVFQSSFGWEFN